MCLGPSIASCWRAAQDGGRRFFHYTGFAWLTPFVGVIDETDLNQLRGAIRRDLAWLQGLPPCTGRASQQAIEGLQALLGEPTAAGQNLRAVRYPWDVSRGWADYGAVRLGVLMALPPEAQLAAVRELRNMASLVIEENQKDWLARVEKLTGELEKGAGNAAPGASGAHTLVHELQALWREVDFGRDKRRRHVAKQTRVLQILWAGVLLVTVVLTCELSPGAECAVAAVPDGTSAAASPGEAGRAGGVLPSPPRLPEPRGTNVAGGEGAGSEVEAKTPVAAPGQSPRDALAAGPQPGALESSNAVAESEATAAVVEASPREGERNSRPAVPALPPRCPPARAPPPWLAVAFGVLGGTLSGLRTTDFTSTRGRRAIEGDAVRLRLRPVVGGAAALVSWVLGNAGLLTTVNGDAPLLPVAVVVKTDAIYWAYLTLALVAGFSERWFVALLDGAAARLGGPGAGSPATPADAPGEKPPAGGAPARPRESGAGTPPAPGSTHGGSGAPTEPGETLPGNPDTPSDKNPVGGATG